MKLRKAFIEDIIELKSICIDAYALNFHSHWNDGGLEWYLDNEFSEKRLVLDLNDKNIAYYFIEDNEKNVGFIKTMINSSSDISLKNSVEIEKIYVLPECKGKGIGKLAFKEILKRSESNEKKSIFLSVIDTNDGAISFYEKLGFKFHSKTILDIPYFKEELKRKYRMIKKLKK
jgi:ribosomal protein S18 acetylase RimI-like enzyme